MTWNLYRRKSLTEMQPWKPGYDMTNISVSQFDAENGSPKPGDMIARDPKNHFDTWLVSKNFATNFEAVDT